MYAADHRDYVERVRVALGVTGRHKSVIERWDVYALIELSKAYNVHFAPEMEVLSTENIVFLE